MNVGGDTHIAGRLIIDNGLEGELTGNAASATKLKTARKINGTDFDGTKAITTNEWGSYRTIQISGEVIGEITMNGSQDVNIVARTELAQDLPLIGLSISPKWDYSGTSTAASIIVEKGEKVKFTGTWKWVHNDANKDPETASGEWGGVVPDTNVASEELVIENITANKTITQRIQAKQKGYKINSENKVVAADATDERSASVSVTFRDRLFYGNVTTKTPDIATIKKLSNELVAGRGKTISGITSPKGSYYCYAYPKGLGNLTGIVQDGATPVLSAFNKTELTYTNDHGLQITLNVYVSANDGAFSKVKLQFT